MHRITLTRPDDWHLHLRDGARLQSVLPDTCARFGRAIVMPNLRPPVVTVQDALAYRERILAARPPGSTFEPLMTLYLTPATTPEHVAAMAGTPVVAIKLYPAGATTNSEAGVTGLDSLDDVFAAMAERGVPLLIHGESTDPSDDVFDREARFIEGPLARLRARHPELKLVLEHITTAEAVAWVRAQPPSHVAATITAHHLLLNRNAMFTGGIRPHHYCLPVLKRERHRLALVEAACSGSPQFFLGTDSAPHSVAAKEAACGCAGMYTAHAAIELYAEVFEAEGALDRLEAFASFHGPDFYGLPRNREKLTLVRESWPVPDTLAFGDERLVPLRAGEPVRWRLEPGPSRVAG
jgi:dihydroorotase